MRIHKKSVVAVIPVLCYRQGQMVPGYIRRRYEARQNCIMRYAVHMHNAIYSLGTSSDQPDGLSQSVTTSAASLWAASCAGLSKSCRCVT